MGTKGNPGIYLLAAVFAAASGGVSAAPPKGYTVPACTLPDDKVPTITPQTGHKVLWSLYHDQGTWNQLMACIESGKPGWIDKAVALRAFSDAGASEQIDNSLGEALGNNPAGVLEKVAASNLELICAGPDIDDPRFDSYALALTEIDRREKALAGVKDASLASLSIECRASLEKSKLGIAHFYGSPAPDPGEAPPPPESQWKS